VVSVCVCECMCACVRACMCILELSTPNLVYIWHDPGHRVMMCAAGMGMHVDRFA